MGKLSVTVVNTFSIYLFLKYGTGDFEELAALSVGPYFVMVIITYTIVSIFLGIFDEIVLSLMTCLAMDIDLNGDPEYGPANFHAFSQEYRGIQVGRSDDNSGFNKGRKGLND